MLSPVPETQFTKSLRQAFVPNSSGVGALMQIVYRCIRINAPLSLQLQTAYCSRCFDTLVCQTYSFCYIHTRYFYVFDAKYSCSMWSCVDVVKNCFVIS